ncbi:MOSC domain-containing protein [Qipengyuania sp. 1XM1-15A]|uniref:MOSC domain-containing protein n=1 Tax=Qipengyuania xiamenensis TaxID=2867237 RepID=UPI001C873E74|nr:MOSC domain-containing protein [Qipengyuania xiamenensis]MBX7531801.1 MOSC domain-containing protein [Qipengyuania xiamenensis]
MSVTVKAICTGLPQPFNGAELSAIAKQPVDGPVVIRTFGIEGDTVADTKHHGGPDMAVHHYPHDHYADWDAWLGGHDLLAGPAAFGENLVMDGFIETGVLIGDRFRFGSALLEISQPRQPCWKIEHRFGRKGMVKRIVKQHNCGWYYRVLEEGEAQAGDTFEKVESGHDGWSVARLFAKLYDPADKPSAAELEEIAALDRLCEPWRDKARKALES